MAPLPKYKVPQIPAKNITKKLLVRCGGFSFLILTILRLILVSDQENADISIDCSEVLGRVNDRLDGIEKVYTEMRSMLSDISSDIFKVSPETNLFEVQELASQDVAVSNLVLASYDLIIGISTIYRETRGEAYLVSTLKGLLEHSSESSLYKIVVLLQISETDEIKSKKIENSVTAIFQTYINSGALKMNNNFKGKKYDKIQKLDSIDSFNDGEVRAEWRTKQNADVIDLWETVATKFKTRYYLHLEDDVILIKETYQSEIFESISNHPDFFMLDFSGIGFIGNLMKSENLRELITFYKLFYKNLPCDWILGNFLRTKYCNFDWRKDNCEQLVNLNKILVKPPVFKHFGRRSTLSGKEQLTSREITENRRDFLVEFEGNRVLKENYYTNTFPLELETSGFVVSLDLKIGIIFLINIEFGEEISFLMKIHDDSTSVLIISETSDSFHLKETMKMKSRFCKITFEFTTFTTVQLYDLYIAAL